MNDLENKKKTNVSVSYSQTTDEMIANLKKQLPEDCPESVFESIRNMYENRNSDDLDNPMIVTVNTNTNEVAKVESKPEPEKNEEG